MDGPPYWRTPAQGERQEGQPQKKTGKGWKEGRGGESWSLEASGLETVSAQWWDDWSPQKRQPGQTALEGVSEKNSALAGCAPQGPEAQTESGSGWDLLALAPEGAEQHRWGRLEHPLPRARNRTTLQSA